MAENSGIKEGINNVKGKIRVLKNGAYMVTGSIPLEKEIVVADEEGTPIKWEKGGKYPNKEKYLLCRCGKSKNKPYCDGTHLKTAFNGAETGDIKKYIDQVETTTGPGIILSDAEKFCSVGLFCHRAGNAWELTEKSDDPQSRETAIQEACDCPSGRLVARDKNTGKPIEPEFGPSIGVIEEPYRKLSGPLWVKGCIPVESADGTQYEPRNRVTLCRCGNSKNKPFCDGTHCDISFNDGDESVR